MANITVAIKTFNERVKTMNQTGGRQLTLSADEARNLHADIFNLLGTIAEYQSRPSETPVNNNIAMDGGGFK